MCFVVCTLSVQRNLFLAFFSTLPIFRAVNFAPLFSAALCDLMASHGHTQVRAAEITGIGRNILVRLSSGEQWPHAEHLAAVAKLATSPDERRRLLDAITSDCAAASGIDRFAVSEDDGHVMLRVPRKFARLVEDALLLMQTNPTGAIALDGVVKSLLPGVIRTEALNCDIAEYRKASKSSKSRKNTGAPTARPSLPPRAKAS